MKKRIFPLLLLCVLLISIPSLAVAPDSLGEEVHAAETIADIPDLIDGVKSAYIPDYTYFVSESDMTWVGEDNIDGEISKPCTAQGNSHGRFAGLWQSHGFGRLVFYRVFGTYADYDYHCNPASLNENVIVVGRLGNQCRELRGSTEAWVSESTVKNLMSRAKIGDLVVCAPRSLCSMLGTTMVFLEANDAGIRVYQADYTGSCAVTEQIIPYATLASYHCVSVLRASNYPTVEYLAPKDIQQVTASSTDVPHNENITISWLPSKYAFTYQVELVNDENQTILTEEVTETSYVLTDVAPDTYTVRITAVNDKGTSKTAVSPAVTIHPMLHVRFLDHDETLIAEQQIVYGGDATAPTVPDRIGYKFAGWDEGLKNIKTDLNVHALYELRQYFVTFYSVNRERLGEPQRVGYGQAAVPPENENNCYGLAEGCVFAGWHIEYGSDGTSYEQVDGDMNVIATQTWGEGALPVTISLTGAILREDGKTYDVTGTVVNTSDKAVSFKLIATLKTSEDKAVKCLVLDEYTLQPNASANVQDSIVYSEKIKAIEYVAVAIQGNDKTGGAYSLLERVDITAKTTWGNWSEWTAVRESGHDGEETKTQYRYRNKVNTTSSTKTLTAPWTYSHETYVWSSYGAWSGWKSSKITASDAVQVGTRTAYKWFYYQCPYCGGHSYYNQHYTWAGGCGKWIDDSYYRTTWGAATYQSGLDFHGTGRYYTNNTDAGRAYCWRAWHNGSGGATQTQYRSRTRSKIFTYHYWKWDEWSQWSDVYTAGTETETRTVYRYRDKVDLSDPNAGVEDSSGKTYTLQGEITLSDGVPTVLDGRRATVMVYKKTNTDPTEAQLEYVDQITIGSGNSYDVTIWPKEEPSEETGCFIVALGIEGCNKLVNVAVIEPEDITHTVRYYVDGELYDTQEVSRGGTAVLPAIPTKEGYQFVRWSETATAVQSDLTINAVFQPVAHSVTFIDWELDTIHQQTVLHGEPIPYPTLEPVSGSEVRMWSTQPKVTVAEENMVIESCTAWKTYTVRFKSNGAVVSTQEVVHGQSAELPAVEPREDGKVFAGWTGECSWNYITCDVVFSPVFVYSQTTAAPQAEVTDNGDGTSSVSLNCETEGAVIYYMIEEHSGQAEVPADEAAEAISEVRLDLLQADLMDVVLEDIFVLPGWGIDEVFGAVGSPLQKNYDFKDEAQVYDGEAITLKEGQSIVFLASAIDMNDSMPQTEYMAEVETDYTARITENSLRQYRSSVEGTLVLAVNSETSLFKECQFTLCLYDDRGVMMDQVPMTVVVAPGYNVIRFEDVVIPTGRACASAKLMGWLSEGELTPVIDVIEINID